MGIIDKLVPLIKFKPILILKEVSFKAWEDDAFIVKNSGIFKFGMAALFSVGREEEMWRLLFVPAISLFKVLLR